MDTPDDATRLREACAALVRQGDTLLARSRVLRERNASLTAQARALDRQSAAALAHAQSLIEMPPLPATFWRGVAEGQPC